VASEDTSTLSVSATGRISAGATPASAIAAMYADAPPWPTEAYTKDATSMPSASQGRIAGSKALVV